ncbi:MAG TPA: hypothetical protein VEA79_09760 [Phenylobacterium sp.]|nr:hypothetical protein [Phenylobacterium sp.]
MSPNLMVAVPTHSGQMESVTTESLLQLQKALIERGGQMTLKVHSGSVISTLRNVIAADFLGSEADTLLMLDADQGISGAGLMRLIDFGEPIVGVIAPKRVYNWSHVDPRETAEDMGRIRYQAMAWAGRLDSAEDGQTEVRDGFARAIHVGSGIMVVQRPAFETMMAAHPELEGVGFNTAEFPPGRFTHNWGFFNPLTLPEEGGAMTEDFSFCHRWRALGGELWADIVTPTVHVGRHVFGGSYLEFIRASQPKG